MPISTNIMTELTDGGGLRQREFNAPAVESRQVCTDATRPSASAYLPGTRIWNTDSGRYEYSDGTNWLTADGQLT